MLPLTCTSASPPERTISRMRSSLRITLIESILHASTVPGGGVLHRMRRHLVRDGREAKTRRFVQRNVFSAGNQYEVQPNEIAVENIRADATNA